MVRDYVDTDDNIGVHESIRTERSQESEGEKLNDFTNTSDGGKGICGYHRGKRWCRGQFQRIRHSDSCVCRRRADGEERTSAG